MNKIILIFAILLFSTGTYAKGCDERSIRGNFSYEVSGVNKFTIPGVGPVTQSTSVVGRATFDGEARTVYIIGKGAAAGALEDRIGHGSYTVDSAACTATGNIDWELPAGAPQGTPPESSTFYIVMDNADNSDDHSSNLAYHANVVVSSDAPYSSSASGSLTRYIRQFH